MKIITSRPARQRPRLPASPGPLSAPPPRAPPRPHARRPQPGAHGLDKPAATVTINAGTSRETLQIGAPAGEGVKDSIGRAGHRLAASEERKRIKIALQAA